MAEYKLIWWFLPLVSEVSLLAFQIKSWWHKHYEKKTLSIDASVWKDENISLLPQC